MNGTILAYSTAAHAGVIEAENGERFYFSRSDLHKDIAPDQGVQVTFEIGQNNAKNIRLRTSRQK
jgi:hypothetical protein